MVSKISQKKNLSSMQVIKTLKVLLQGNFTMHELIKKLNENEKEPVFNNSVISKYINTCRFCGIDIPKVQNKYYIASMPFGLELSFADIELLKQMQVVIKNDTTTNFIKKFDKLIEKLNRFSKTKIAKINKDEFNFSFELFEQAVAKKRKIKLLFKNRVVQECIPLNISQIGNKTFFNVYNKRIRQIDINRLSGVSLSDNSFTEKYNGSQVVVFKLKDGLAKRYEARENEAVQQCPDGTILVTNRNENEELLISRLLRYDDKCEVIQPKMFREKFKNVVNDILKNYGES